MPCTNCGNTMVDVYCANCGEKQPGHHDLTVRHLAHELADELFHLDSKLFRTLRDLMLRPGELTAAYFEGRKRRYVAPLRLLFALFALTFLAYSSYKQVAIYSIEGVLAMDTAGNLQKVFEREAAKRNMRTSELVSRVEQRWQRTMSLLNLASVVIVAVLLKLLYVRHRRYFAEHLVFSTHYLCFMYLLSLLLWPVYLAVGLRQNFANAVLTFVMFAISCVYIYLALRRVYGQGGAKTLVKTVVLWVGTSIATMVLMFGSLFFVLARVLRS